VFGEYNLPLTDKTSFKAGARGDFGHTDTDTLNSVATDENDKKLFNTLTGNVQLDCKTSESFEVFTGLARGARVPDPQELYVSVPGATNFSGNPDLRSTLNDEVDIGARYCTKTCYVNATLFYSTLTDFINLRGFQAGAASNVTYENVDATMWGVEIGSQVSLCSDLFLKAGVSYSEGQNTTSGMPLSEIPPLKGTAALRYDRDSYFIEAAENLSARQYRIDTSLNEAQTDGWDTTDLKAGWTRGSLSIYAGVYNLFDKYYYTYLSYLRDPFASGVKMPENGQSFFVTVSYRI
jgi:iron complex outermembrane receptor protein